MPQLKIASLTLPNNLTLAPMAGFTNLPFRLICKELGAGLVFSEMISAEALIRNNQKTDSLLDTDPTEGPLIIQICGGKKETLRDATLILQERGAKAIDFNMGCPVPKIVKSGAGAALSKNPSLIEKILNEMMKVATVPITVKLRKGWDDNSVNCLEICKIAQDKGVSLVSLHGRTAKQGYRGTADWEIIKAAKKILSIPLLGNGDVNSPEDAGRMLEYTGCDGVMIGRGCLGNPWLFRETFHYLETGELMAGPSREERTSIMIRHFDLAVEKFGEYAGIRLMRKFWGYYIKGRQGSARLRDKLVRLERAVNIREEISEFGIFSGA
jgi:tRNA-dihydrouridine synthase B